MALPRLADRLQGPDLRRRLQAVPALDLGGGGAGEEHLIEARPQEGHECAPIDGPRGGHGAHDPAARGRDLLVARAGQPLPDLAVAIVVRPQQGFRTDVLDPAVLRDKGGGVDLAHGSELGTETRRAAGGSDQLSDVADDEIARHRPRDARTSSARAPATRSTLSRPFAPRVTDTAEGATPR